MSMNWWISNLYTNTNYSSISSHGSISRRTLVYIIGTINFHLLLILLLIIIIFILILHSSSTSHFHSDPNCPHWSAQTHWHRGNHTHTHNTKTFSLNSLNIHYWIYFCNKNGGQHQAATIAELSSRFSIISGRRWPVMNKMSVRRGVRGSFRGSLRRYGSAEYSRRPYRHHNWVFRNGEWRIAFGKCLCESVYMYVCM